MGRSVYRTIILIPLMIPPVIGALMWKIMLEPTRGPINYLIGLFGGRSLEWLSSPKLAMPTVMLIDFYLFTPFAILILLAGLQSIPIDLYEAAKVDGAGPIRSFFAVTLPLMWPTLTLVFLIRFTLSLATFDIIFATTGGGPGIATTTLSIQSYLNYYRWSFTSTATTYGMIIWIISLIFTNVFIARTRRGWR
ncbi:MAG: sugar ABC transporter permease [Actinobacteria bacterium]|nr:sugar ABC transporter permease [Actinomycetota bacterium]